MSKIHTKNHNPTPDWPALTFPVSLRPIETRVGTRHVEIPHTRAVYREDTEQTLDLVSTRYKLVPHESFFRPMHEAVQQLGTGLKGVRTATGEHGGYAEVIWILDQEIVIGQGDRLAVVVRAENSINRSTTLQVELSAMRLSCSNMLRGPGPQFRREWKHYESLEQDNVTESLQALLERVPKAKEYWNSWAQVFVSAVDLDAWLLDDAKARQVVGKLAREELVERLGGPSARVSVWECYNALTYHATHDITSRNPELLTMRKNILQGCALRCARDLHYHNS